MSEIIYGWNAYAKWANSFNLRNRIISTSQPKFPSRDYNSRACSSLA